MGSITEGAVVDVQVVATSQVSHIVERRAIHRALRKLTGAEVPNKTGAWTAWIKAREAPVVTKTAAARR